MTLAKTIKSLLNQDVDADHIILWISHQDKSSLPGEVIDLQNFGLTIHFCEDLKSYKKIVPALEAFPDCYIVTADDDVFYNEDWLRSLIRTYNSRKTIVACRCHLAEISDDGYFMPYRTWTFSTSRLQNPNNHTRLFPTGVGGVLYPPGSLDCRVTDASTFSCLCPNGDDIWLYWMAKLAGSLHFRTRRYYPIISWDSSQECALFHDNLFGGGNDRQIRNMESTFGRLP